MVDKNLVERAMEELEISQNELARVSGVSANSLIEWKKDENKIPKWGIKLLTLLMNEHKNANKLKIFDDFAKVIKDIK